MKTVHRCVAKLVSCTDSLSLVVGLDGTMWVTDSPFFRKRLVCRRRMRGAMDRMARVGLSPTNKEISRILGVPKGTVDSGLYWLKKKLAQVYDPDTFRSA